MKWVLPVVTVTILTYLMIDHYQWYDYKSLISIDIIASDDWKVSRPM